MIILFFFVMNYLIGSQELLLLNTSAHFSSLIETTKQQSSDPDKNLDMLQRYHNVCMDAYKAIQEKRPVADDVLYRIEIAKIICGVGFVIFNTHIKPFLSNWTALLLLKTLQSPPDVEWKGASIYFERMILKASATNMLGNDQFGYGGKKDAAFYYFEWVTMHLNYETINKYISYIPSDGIIFCSRFYYGLIDYTKKKASLYGSKQQVIDFSLFLPWDTIKGKRGQVAFNENMMRCSWWNSYHETKPIWQACYTINDPYEIDFSQPEIYS